MHQPISVTCVRGVSAGVRYAESDPPMLGGRQLDDDSATALAAWNEDDAMAFSPEVDRALVVSAGSDPASGSVSQRSPRARQSPRRNPRNRSLPPVSPRGSSRSSARPSPPRAKSPGTFASPLLSGEQQLCSFLFTNNVALLDLFHTWDTDGSGTLDKQEFRRGITTLGFYATSEVVDNIFKLIDTDGDGTIDMDEMKRAVNAFLKGQRRHTQPMPLAHRSPSREGSPTSGRRTPSPVGSPRSPGGRQHRALPPVAFLGVGPGEDAGEVVVPARGKHTHTVIMLHPEAESVEAIYGRIHRRFKPFAVHLKFVFPRAPDRAHQARQHVGHRPSVVSAAREPPMRYWFVPHEAQEGYEHFDEHVAAVDSAIGRVDEGITREHIDAQSNRIHALIEREASQLRGGVRHVILGGTGQGGSMALHAAMTFRSPLCGLLCLRCPVLEGITGPPADAARMCRTPIFVLAGGTDEVCPPLSVQESFAPLERAGFHVLFHVEPGLSHTAESLNEQRFAAYWAALAASGDSAAPDPRVLDALQRAVMSRGADSHSARLTSLSQYSSTSASSYCDARSPSSPLRSPRSPRTHSLARRSQALARRSQQPIQPMPRAAHQPLSARDTQGRSPPHTARADLLQSSDASIGSGYSRPGSRSASGYPPPLSERHLLPSRGSEIAPSEGYAMPLPGERSFHRGLRRAYGTYGVGHLAPPAPNSKAEEEAHLQRLLARRLPREEMAARWRNWELFG